MAERTLAEALAHAEKVRQVDSSQSIATYLEDYVVLADEVLRLRVELEQAPERSRMAMLERIGLLKKAEAVSNDR